MKDQADKYQINLNDEAVRDLLPILFNELKEDYLSLQKTLQAKDHLGLKKCVHKLKGLAKNFHFSELLESCLELEDCLSVEPELVDFEKLETLSKPIKKAVTASIRIAAERYGVKADPDNFKNLNEYESNH